MWLRRLSGPIPWLATRIMVAGHGADPHTNHSFPEQRLTHFLMGAALGLLVGLKPLAGADRGRVTHAPQVTAMDVLNAMLRRRDMLNRPLLTGRLASSQAQGCRGHGRNGVSLHEPRQLYVTGHAPRTAVSQQVPL